MSLPTKLDVVQHLREHYQLSLQEVRTILTTDSKADELRDKYAGLVMQTLLTMNRAELDRKGKFNSLPLRAVVSALAFEIADEMLKARRYVYQPSENSFQNQKETPNCE